MAKKNHDSRSFNRTGLFDFATMTITYEDKNGVQVFDLKGELEKVDGLEVAFSGTTEVPASPADEE